jgi:hypothetical protein
MELGITSVGSVGEWGNALPRGIRVAERYVSPRWHLAGVAVSGGFAALSQQLALRSATMTTPTESTSLDQCEGQTPTMTLTVGYHG